MEDICDKIKGTIQKVENLEDHHDVAAIKKVLYKLEYTSI